MVNVELIYDSDCPNVEQARRQLKKAFAKAGLEPRLLEWERGDANSPEYVRAYGSPTILVDGRDVAGTLPGRNARCCRIYSDKNGNFNGVPSLETITSELLKAEEKGPTSTGAVLGQRRKWCGGFGVFGVIGTVLLPGISCPACWPAYVAFLSSMGLGFVNYTPYLFPLMAMCLLVALFSLGFRARRRRGFGPFILGLVAALVILTGKFKFDLQAVTYAGVVLLVAASVWNLWPLRKAEHKQPGKGVTYEC